MKHGKILSTATIPPTFFPIFFAVFMAGGVPNLLHHQFRTFNQFSDHLSHVFNIVKQKKPAFSNSSSMGQSNFLLHKGYPVGKTLNNNDRNQVADQRIKQWITVGAHSCRLIKTGSAHCYLRISMR